MKNAGINIYRQHFVCYIFSVLLDLYLGVEIMDHMVTMSMSPAFQPWLSQTLRGAYVGKLATFSDQSLWIKSPPLFGINFRTFK